MSLRRAIYVVGARLIALSILGSFCQFGSPAVQAQPLCEVLERVSVSSAGVEADDVTESPASISFDGRFVAFNSIAGDLVPGDTNGETDTFVHDRLTGRTERVSVTSGGLEANGFSGRPSISPDGRFVAFDSRADNLVVGDTNGTEFDTYMHDRATGVTELVSVATDGTQGNGFSGRPDISGDGRLVLFISQATNLVTGDTNGSQDAFAQNDIEFALTPIMPVLIGGP